MRYILVTGGAGYIGSHICEKFFKQGYTPVTFDNLLLGNKWSVKWGPLEIGDLLDKDRLNELFQKYSFEGVIHLAALSNVEKSYTEPALYYENNLHGSLNLLEKMTEFNVNKLVFSSTAAVYGKPEYTPIDENHPKNPVNCYGDTKMAVEKLIYNIANASNLNFISLRYFNVSGSNYRSKIGEAHDPESHIIPLALEAAQKNTHFKINGKDYDTFDGTCVRDFIHVNDLSDVHFISFKKLMSMEIREFVNIGGGQGFSILEVIESVKKITGFDVLTEIGDRRIGDPHILISKIQKSKELLSWEPSYSNIDTIVFDSWKWYKIYHSI